MTKKKNTKRKTKPSMDLKKETALVEESSKSEEKEETTVASKFSENWRWIGAIFDEAHLPHLGLPVRWEDTKKEHAKTVYDPDTKKPLI